jgi:cytoskeletal protein CcmA (bactofilin family)
MNMYKKLITNIFFVLVLCFLTAQPVMATSTDEQGGGGVKFGPYTLESGNSASGDLVVFGGPVVLEEDSQFDGDLTVIGELSVKQNAIIDGQLVVLGNAHIAGQVEGDIFVAGPVNLSESAYIDGDLSVVGQLSQDDGAVVEGEITIEQGDWDFPVRIVTPVPDFSQPEVIQVPFWLKTMRAIARAMASIIILALLALVTTSLWSQQVDRIGRTIEENPLVSFGAGFLALIIAVLVTVLLAITICLSPFAIVIVVVVSLGILMGWIALGLVLGRKILTALFNQSQSKITLAAIVGTTLLTALLAMTRIFGPLYALLVVLLVPPAAGAVLLTRFGTIPYATRGGVVGGVANTFGLSPSRQEMRPAPRPGDTIRVSQETKIAEQSGDENGTSPSNISGSKVIDLEAEDVDEVTPTNTVVDE